jgi:hypothetical protein
MRAFFLNPSRMRIYSHEQEEMAAGEPGGPGQGRGTGKALGDPGPGPGATGSRFSRVLQLRLMLLRETTL